MQIKTSIPVSVISKPIVPDVFSVIVQHGENLIFSELKPGNQSDGYVSILVSTNQGKPWSILIDSALLTNGTDILPISTLSYKINGQGIGEYIPNGSDFVPIPTVPTKIYNSLPSEGMEENMSFSLHVKIDLPQTAVPGTYTALINMTLIDSDL